MANVKTRACIGISEVCFNLLLSVVLVMVFDFSINGVAIGMMVPTLVFIGVVLPITANDGWYLFCICK